MSGELRGGRLVGGFVGEQFAAARGASRRCARPVASDEARRARPPVGVRSAEPGRHHHAGGPRRRRRWPTASSTGTACRSSDGAEPVPAGSPPHAAARQARLTGLIGAALLHRGVGAAGRLGDQLAARAAPAPSARGRRRSRCRGRWRAGAAAARERRRGRTRRARAPSSSDAQGVALDPLRRASPSAVMLRRFRQVLALLLLDGNARRPSRREPRRAARLAARRARSHSGRASSQSTSARAQRRRRPPGACAFDVDVAGAAREARARRGCPARRRRRARAPSATTPAESGPFATRSPTSTTRSSGASRRQREQRQQLVEAAVNVADDDRPRCRRSSARSSQPADDGRSAFADGDLVHLDRRLRPIAGVRAAPWRSCRPRPSRRHLAEHRVLRRAGREPVEVRVVDDVDEELAAAAVRARCWPSTACRARSRSWRRAGARPGCGRTGCRRCRRAGCSDPCCAGSRTGP